MNALMEAEEEFFAAHERCKFMGGDSTSKDEVSTLGAYAKPPARFQPYPLPVIERGKLLEVVV